MTVEEQKYIELIKLELVDSLIPEVFRDNKVQHPMYGHCHHASLALYALLGGKSKGYKLQKAIDDLEIIHYWLATSNNDIIDITSAQYTDLNRPLPYCNKIDNRASYRHTRGSETIIKNVKKYESKN